MDDPGSTTLDDESPQTNTASTGHAVSGVDSLDREAASEAYRKVLEGKTLTSREQTLLKRLEKEKEERLRWQYYNSIPQKHWREMSGRQPKILQEQAERYGIPFGGAQIRLLDVVRALHNFLADNAHKLAKDDDDLMQGAGSPALERYREERAALARMDRLERERQLLPRDEIRDMHGRVSSILRGAGEALQRQFGPEAVELLYDALDDSQREMDRCFAEGQDEPRSQPADLFEAPDSPRAELVPAPGPAPAPALDAAVR